MVSNRLCCGVVWGSAVRLEMNGCVWLYYMAPSTQTLGVVPARQWFVMFTGGCVRRAFEVHVYIV